jgi:hypothetical protein
MTTDREDVNKLIYPTYRRGWEPDAVGA